MAQRYGMEYDGGGMNGGGYGDASPAPSTPNRPRKGYDEQTLIPITIRMALNSESGSMTLSDGRETHQVKVVGAIREVMKQSTNIVYTIEDGTGLIEVKEWCDDANDNPALMQIREEAGQDHVYVRVIGKLQEYDGKKHIIGYSVRKIRSGNELTHHLLEVVHSTEKFKRGNQIVGAPYQVNAPAGVGFGSPQAVTPVKQAVMGMSLGMGGGDGDDMKGSLMQYIKSVSNNDMGANISIFIQQNAGRYRENDIRKAVEDLSSEGLIYSTVDDDHYTGV